MSAAAVSLLLADQRRVVLRVLSELITSPEQWTMLLLSNGALMHTVLVEVSMKFKEYHRSSLNFLNLTKSIIKSQRHAVLSCASHFFYYRYRMYGSKSPFIFHTSVYRC